jgi:hypothetical protein
MNYLEKRKFIWKRARRAYAGALGIPGVVLVFSYAQGSNWEPVLIGLPVYLVIFVSITIQLVRELRALERDS